MPERIWVRKYVDEESTERIERPENEQSFLGAESVDDAIASHRHKCLLKHPVQTY